MGNTSIHCIKRGNGKMKMKKYLITGCAGFIGSNFVYYMLKKYQDILLVNLDKLTYAGNLENLKGVEGDPRHVFVQGDICDKDLVASLFEKYDFDYVINFAAESHVDRSIANPEIFVRIFIVYKIHEAGAFLALDEIAHFDSVLNIVHKDGVLLDEFGIFKVLQFIQRIRNGILRHGWIEPPQRCIQFLLVQRTAKIPFNIGTVDMTVPHIPEQFYDGIFIVRFRIKS